MKTYTIKKTAGISLQQLYSDLSSGGHIVSYGYCVSILALTFRLMSSPHFIKPSEKLSQYRLGYNLRSLFLGWWGFPWGPIYTIDMLKINYKTGGGIDITDDILTKIKVQYADTDDQHIFEEDITVDYDESELVR